MPASPQLVQITCPNCGNTFRAEIYNLVDPAQQPELKQMLLAGRLNIANCTNCGLVSMIAMPVAYHDSAKQAFFICIPQEVNMPPEEEERFIGEISSSIITTLPAHVQRGYILTPRRFMSLSSLVDAILEADGIPREVIEQQRTRVNLITDFAEALDNEERFKQLVEQHKESLTPEFFAMLTNFVEASVQQNQHESAQILLHLRDTLAKLTGLDGDFDSEMPEGDLNEIFERLEQASDENLDETIAEVRPFIDYSFFQQWTERIEAVEQSGNKTEAERLYQRRTLTAERVEQIDKEAQAIFEHNANLLREVLESSDPKAVLEQHGSEIGEAFMLLASANMESAARAGEQEIVERLEEIQALAIEVVQARLPADERLVNELLMAESAGARTKLFSEHTDIVTTEFVKKLNELAEQQEKRGMKETATRLRQLAREATAMLF